jgi:hypothetical protein
MTRDNRLNEKAKERNAEMLEKMQTLSLELRSGRTISVKALGLLNVLSKNMLSFKKLNPRKVLPEKKNAYLYYRKTSNSHPCWNRSRLWKRWM